MRVIVCGAGRVGSNIARHLARLNNDVTVIDQSESLIQRISEQLDVRALIGHAADPSMLAKAGAEDTDVIIGATLSDEVNMVACQVASSLFQVPTKIARIRNQIYLKKKWADLFSHDNMPIDVTISPEQEVARALLRRVSLPGAFNNVHFLGGKGRIIGLDLPGSCPVLDTPLKQLTELFPKLSTTVIGIVRGESMFVPRSRDSLQAGDKIYLAVDENMIERAMGVFGFEHKSVSRIVMVGGGNIGLMLAREMENLTPKPFIKLIERDADRAAVVAGRLKDVVVINGDGLNVDILQEAGISESDMVVAVADDDEVNILASMLAKQQGCPRALALINNPIYSSLSSAMSIDVTMDPRETTVSSIVRHLRRGRIRDLYSLNNGEAEILEIEVIEGSDATGKTVRELKMGNDMRIGLILRDDIIIIPSPETKLLVEDRVVLIAMERAVKDVEKMFSPRADIF